MIDNKIYLAGEFVTTDKKLVVTNPFDDSVVGETYLAGSNELEKAISKAESVKDTMRDLPSYAKYKILNQIANEIIERKNELALILAREAGKPLKYALGEIDRAVLEISVSLAILHEDDIFSKIIGILARVTNLNILMNGISINFNMSGN